MGVNIELLCLVCVYHTAKTPPWSGVRQLFNCHSTATVFTDASSDEDIKTNTIPEVRCKILLNVMYIEMEN